MATGPVALVAVLAAWLVCAEARAACIDAPDLAAYQTASPEDFAYGATRTDRRGRVVAPVTVNGQGPFRFIVDTGANRSAVSQALAERLGLTANGMGEVHSVHGVAMAPMVEIASLSYGDLFLGDAPLPMLQSGVLGSAHGLLGVDGMRGRRLRMDFERNCIEIAPSRGARRLRGWTAIRGELQSGHLVVVRGAISGVGVNLFLDTGSDASLANFALRDALNARIRRGRPEEAHTIGRTVVLTDAIVVRRMTMGDLAVRNFVAYVGDFHIFRLWGLNDEPTMLVGMDVLSQARGLAIDYDRATVYLHIRD
jgi:predicted aspartyl protease